jgi:hypothetical protein
MRVWQKQWIRKHGHHDERYYHIAFILQCHNNSRNEYFADRDRISFCGWRYSDFLQWVDLSWYGNLEQRHGNSDHIFRYCGQLFDNGVLRR